MNLDTSQPSTALVTSRYCPYTPGYDPEVTRTGYLRLRYAPHEPKPNGPAIRTDGGGEWSIPENPRDSK